MTDRFTGSGVFSSSIASADFRSALPTEAVTFPLQTDEHVVALRKLVRERTIEMKFSLVDQTKLVTAASELARNTLKYGGGGEVRTVVLSDAGRQGFSLTFIDRGPGIADIEQALRDGYTSGGGLGLGLGGAKRLVDGFEIHSTPGEGTSVTITKWKR
jgi:serine/threonine-protein kinase RsbT